jgi:hypothetical protein
VDEVERDTNHCKNSKDVIFWNELIIFVTLNNILQAIIAFLHYNAWKIMLILDDVNDFTNHRVFKRP